MAAPRAGADGEARYRVVRNDEEQYSIWPLRRDLPPGWWPDGYTGTREECLDHIRAVWPDIRPLSLRRRLGAAAPAR